MHRILRVLLVVGMLFATVPWAFAQVGEPLVELISLDSSLTIDLKYATADNFVGEKLYTTARCFLRRSVAERLVRVQRKLQRQGLGLKIWDGYRPLSVQKKNVDTRSGAGTGCQSLSRRIVSQPRRRPSI